MTAKDIERPQIGVIITPEGVKGAAVFGSTLKERQRSLALLELLEPDLIELQSVLNSRIEALRKNNRILQA